MPLAGSTLLHEVAKRIIARYLERTGATGVTVSRHLRDEAVGVDITYSSGAARLAVKVKADSYFGTDPVKAADRALALYRPETHSYGLESVADATTREAGWIQRSQADELFYYRLVIAQPEAEVAALMEGPDEVFFSELAVERDDLRIVPMRELRRWFEANADRYTPRPVITDGRPAWYRLVPEGDLEAGVQGIRTVGPIFRRAAGG
jgi:hypothetical protein